MRKSQTPQKSKKPARRMGEDGSGLSWGLPTIFLFLWGTLAPLSIVLRVFGRNELFSLWFFNGGCKGLTEPLGLAGGDP